MWNSLRYRPNVACILQYQECILIGERSDKPGSWQFPQGGIMEGETPEQALAREVREEVGMPPTSYRIVLKKGPYRYLFGGSQTREGYAGQEQTYFLAHLLGTDLTLPMPPDVEAEFSRFQWIRPDNFQLHWVAPFKQKVYQQIFHDFFNVQIA